MGATFSRVKTWVDSEYLVASDLNGEFDNILNNMTPSGVDDASETDTAMRATADPYSGGAISRPTDLLGEIQRLRYMVQRMTGMGYWYLPPRRQAFIPANVMTVPTSGGAEVGKAQFGSSSITMPYLSFDGASEEYAYFLFMPDANWDLSTMKVKVLWAGSTGCSTGDNVEWEVAIRAITDDEVAGNQTATSVVINDTVTANDGVDLQVTAASSAITVGGTPGSGSMLVVTVSRNVGGMDDMPEDARLFGVWIQYGVAASTVTAW